jgi:hypothetical protein
MSRLFEKALGEFGIPCGLVVRIENAAKQELAGKSRKPREPLFCSFESLARFLIKHSYRAFVGGFCLLR